MFKVNAFKLRNNQRYNYTPRYYNGKKDTNIYDFDLKINKYREQKNAIDFGSHWAEDRKQMRTRSNRSINKNVIIIAMILLIIFLWIIDFDLSIFTQ
ncbi:MAG: hypothetical protein RI558_05885 [Psychroflexus sp.]|jgi:hypothetical protein|nr:hypothetical protein [Psychroflexus sp.]MDR9448808.1 hypothetical protein [Psychroflexus sp.]